MIIRIPIEESLEQDTSIPSSSVFPHLSARGGEKPLVGLISLHFVMMPFLPFAQKEFTHEAHLFAYRLCPTISWLCGENGRHRTLVEQLRPEGRVHSH